MASEITTVPGSAAVLHAERQGWACRPRPRPRVRSKTNEIAHDHEFGIDADPDVECAGRSRWRVEPLDRLNDRQTGTDRPLCVGFVGLRIAEIDQNAVAHVTSNKSVEAGDQAGDVSMKGADGLAQVLRVEPLADRRRSDQIDEHHAQQPAFGCGHPGRDWWSATHKPARSAAIAAVALVGGILAAAGTALPGQRGATVPAKLLVGRDHRAAMGAYHTVALLLFETR